MSESFKSCYHHLSCRSVSLGPLFISLLARSWCYAKKISAHKYFFLHWGDQRHSWTLFQSFCVAMRLQWEYSSPKYRSNCNLTKRVRHTNTDGSDRLRPFNQERLKSRKPKQERIVFSEREGPHITKLRQFTSDAVRKLKYIWVTRIVQQENSKIGDIHQFTSLFLKLQRNKHRINIRDKENQNDGSSVKLKTKGISLTQSLSRLPNVLCLGRKKWSQLPERPTQNFCHEDTCNIKDTSITFIKCLIWSVVSTTVHKINWYQYR